MLKNHKYSSHQSQQMCNSAIQINMYTAYVNQVTFIGCDYKDHTRSFYCAGYTQSLFYKTLVSKWSAFLQLIHCDPCCVFLYCLTGFERLQNIFGSFTHLFMLTFFKSDHRISVDFTSGDEQDFVFFKAFALIGKNDCLSFCAVIRDMKTILHFHISLHILSKNVLFLWKNGCTIYIFNRKNPPWI